MRVATRYTDKWGAPIVDNEPNPNYIPAAGIPKVTAAARNGRRLMTMTTTTATTTPTRMKSTGTLSFALLRETDAD